MSGESGMGGISGLTDAECEALDEEFGDAIIDELARCYRDDNDAAGWDGFRDLFPDDFEAVVAMASRMPLRMASGM